MALDATFANRAKDNFSLSVEYNTIYKTTNERLIREVMGFECDIIDQIATLNESALNELKKSKEKYKNYSDRELAELRQAKSEILKTLLKPDYEVITHNIADDNTVAGMIMNNKTGKTENYKIELSEGKNISLKLNEVIEELVNLPPKTSKAKVQKIRREMMILEQIEQDEKKNKI